jgi:CBS domain-containing protein
MYFERIIQYSPPCKSSQGKGGSAMIVKTILAAKNGEVVSIEPTADLVAAAKLLSTHRIGVLVVIDAEGRLIGILSERDIVRALAKNAGAALQLPVAQVMTRNVLTCDVNDAIGTVLKRMTTGKFRHMPVLDNHRLVGLVSIGDIGKQHMQTLHDHVRQLDEYIDHMSLMKL